jgi:hypothetical protein
MMKKLLVLTLVLAIGPLASAGLEVMVNGVVADEHKVDGQVEIGINAVDEPATIAPFIAISGPATLDAVGVNTIGDGLIMAIDDADIKALLGADALAFAELVILQVPPVIMNGPVVTGMLVTYAGPDPVTVSLINSDTFEEIASTSLVPEPMTLALLGLGGLFLRRRK